MQECKVQIKEWNFLIQEEKEEIIGVHFMDEIDLDDAEKGKKKIDSPIIKETINQLTEYFEGKRKEFHLPLAPKGTPFQQKVWKALQEIPYGETRSYQDIAVAVGNPKGCRAVGMANNQNPIPIIIPCHRVIGKNGKMVGYGAGLDKKIKLLQLEGILD